ALLFGFHDGNRAVFGVKGTTPIAVYTAEGSQQIAGTEAEPFVLRSLDGVRRTAFGDLPLEDGSGAPRVEGGIVPVRGFVHVTTDPAQLEEDERAALAAQVEEDGRSIEDPETKKRRAERPAPRSISSVSTPPSSSRPAASASPTGAMSSTPPRSGAGSSTAPRGAEHVRRTLRRRRDPGQNGPRTVTAPAAGCGFVAHRLLRPGAGGTGCAGGGGRPRARGCEPPRGHGRADRTQASPRELLPVRP